MDTSLTLALHFARLVGLLRHTPEDVAGQKGALRALMTLVVTHGARVHLAGGRMAVNDTFPGQQDESWHELEERFEEHRIEQIDISRGASPGEVLAVARVLAADVALDATEETTLDAIERLGSATVTVRAASTVYESLALDVERAACGAQAGELADRFTRLLQRESALSDAEARLACGRAVRRLTRPTTLRAVARLLLTEPARASQVIHLLQRCGSDGVEAVVDLIVNARSTGDRRVLHDVLMKLPDSSAVLVAMLADPRWHVVCAAIDLLAARGSGDGIRAIAELKRHEDRRVRRAIVRAVGSSDGPLALEVLLKGLADAEAAIRLEAVAALAARGSARSSADLGSTLAGEENAEVLHAVLWALAQIGSPDAVHQIAAAVAPRGVLRQKKHPGLRAAAVVALGEMRLPSALAALRALANDRDREVRDAVARVLASHRHVAA